MDPPVCSRWRVTIRVIELFNLGGNDNGTGRRTTRHAGDAELAAVTDEVRANQEVGDESRLFDDAEFDLKTVNDFLNRLRHVGIVMEILGR